MVASVSRRRKAVDIKMRDELAFNINPKTSSDLYCNLLCSVDFT